MKTFHCMSQERLAELLVGFRRVRVAVVGDFFLDKYLDVDPALAELSVETGKTAHQVVTVRHSPGAAGTVTSNLLALGPASVSAVGFTGEDGESYDMRRDLAALGCKTDNLHIDVERMTPTYLKPRDVNDASLAGEHSRYDTKNRTPTSLATQQQIIRSIEALLPQVDAVVVQDQATEPECGVVTTAIREFLAQIAPRWPKVVFFADSRCRIKLFRNMIIKPNQFEAIGNDYPAPGDEVSSEELDKALVAMKAMTGAPIFVTRGPKGIFVADHDMTAVPGVRVEGPIDSTGAGDSVTAGTALALAAGGAPPEAA